MFQESSGELSAYRWSGGEWEFVGRVAPAMRRAATETSKEELDGELFDKVIAVEIDSASKGLLVLHLGFNDEDDPDEVARRFCAKRR